MNVENMPFNSLMPDSCMLVTFSFQPFILTAMVHFSSEKGNSEKVTKYES